MGFSYCRLSSNVLKRKICTYVPGAHWLNGQILQASKCCCSSCRLLCTSWFVVIYLQVVGPVKVPQSPPPHQSCHWKSNRLFGFWLFGWESSVFIWDRAGNRDRIVIVIPFVCWSRDLFCYCRRLLFIVPRSFVVFSSLEPTAFQQSTTGPI